MFAVIVGIAFIKMAWNIEGVASKLLIVLGILVVLKGLFLLKRKVAARAVDWLAKQPLIMFRAWALCYVAFGAFLVWGFAQGW